MAVTDNAATLTEQHRQAQIRVRALALRDYLRLWSIWKIDDPSSFALLVAASLPLVRTYERFSSTLAASYYTAFRAAEAIPGAATPTLAAPIVEAELAASLYATGQVATKKAILAGAREQEARSAALVRTSGSITRHVLNGGRTTMLQSIAADKKALGWARVTDGQPCAFCAMLAGRGPVYKSEHTAEFHAHDHCACMAEPFYRGSSWPGRSREYRDLYNQAVRDATASGELDRGTNNDLLNAFRRVYDDGR